MSVSQIINLNKILIYLLICLNNISSIILSYLQTFFIKIADWKEGSTPKYFFPYISRGTFVYGIDLNSSSNFAFSL